MGMKIILTTFLILGTSWNEHGLVSSSTTTSSCTGDGFFADPDSADCSTYLQCVEISGTFYEEILSCPSGSYYNPDSADCETSYSCTATTTVVSTTTESSTTDEASTTVETTTESATTTETPTTTETSSTTEESTTTESTETPTTTETSSTTVEPSTTEATETPTTTETSSTTEEYTTTESATTTETPTTTETSTTTDESTTVTTEITTVSESSTTTESSVTTDTSTIEYSTTTEALTTFDSTTTLQPTTVTPAIECNSTGRFADPDANNCQNYILCILDTVTNIHYGYKYNCPCVSIFDPVSQLCVDPEDYECPSTTSVASVCTSNGYITNPTSSDCTSYIQCVKISAVFQDVGIICPGESYFNPYTSICETDYICGTATAPLETTTVMVTTTTESSESTEAPEEGFTCTADGRFADATDTTCQSYILCVLYTDSNTFVAYSYICPSTSVFDHDKAICTDPSNYNCLTSTSSNNTSSSATCTASGRFQNTSDSTCQSYFLCVEQTDGSFLKYDYVCPSTAVFDPTKSICVDPANYVCSTSSTSSENNTGEICTTDGFFADSDSTDCSTYIQCVELDDEFEKYDIECPNNTLYNPDTTNCVTDYVCTATTTDSPETTTQTSVEAFTCTSPGRFANTSDPTCQYYIMCVLDSSSNTYTAYSYVCPSTSVFNPSNAVCTDPANYECPTESTSSSTTAATTTTSCSASGRFADTTDSTCQQYYLCVEQTDGSFEKYDYVCPSVSVFNPTTKVCTTSYTCST